MGDSHAIFDISSREAVYHGPTVQNPFRSFQVNVDDLCCPICLELFVEPKSLPCLHTFCQKCICDHIKHSDTAFINGRFPCPICRENFDIPDARKPLKDWASQLKTNFFIKNLIESRGSGGQRSKPTTKSSDGIVCEKHKTKQRDMICVDFDTQICAMCAFETRKRCKEVYTLQQTAKRKKEEIRLLLKSIHERQKRNALIQDQICTSKQVLRVDKLSALTKIEQTEKLLMSAVKNGCNKARSHVTAKYDKAFRLLESEENTSTAVRVQLGKINTSAKKLLTDMYPRRTHWMNQYKDKTKQMEAWVYQLREIDRKQKPCPTFQLEFLPHNTDRWLKEIGQIKLMKVNSTTQFPIVPPVPRTPPSPLIPTAPPAEMAFETSPHASLYPTIQSVRFNQTATQTTGQIRSFVTQAHGVTRGQGHRTTTLHVQPNQLPQSVQRNLPRNLTYPTRRNLPIASTRIQPTASTQSNKRNSSTTRTHPTISTHPTQWNQPKVSTHSTQRNQLTVLTHPSQRNQPTVSTHSSQRNQPTVSTHSNQGDPFTTTTHPSQLNQPTVSTHPTQQNQPTVSTDPTQQNQSSVSTHPTQQNQPTVSTHPTQQNQSTVSTHPTQQNQSTVSTHPTQQNQSTVSTHPTQQNQSTVSTHPTQQNQSTVSTHPTQQNQSTAPTHPVQQVNPTNPAQLIQANPAPSATVSTTSGAVGELPSRPNVKEFDVLRLTSSAGRPDREVWYFVTGFTRTCGQLVWVTQNPWSRDQS